jgi:glycine/D-amino acid oxidase-like deaminating enzyme
VVGAGFTGLWAAYEAALEGRSVVVVDSGPVAGGASGRCGGFVNSSITHGLAHGAGQWPDEIGAIVALQNELWDDTLELFDRRGAGDVIQPVGKLTVALRPHQLADLDASVAVHRRHGYDVERLDVDALAD